ncbi:transport and Golgi organization protein 2 isoform X1 [Helicoverpa armigera]|uniref:transport and Golgi organization protein 2 isoform X1 n=2 Tax=Helicoverpa armigera TaxID=29058 RepID=UPI003083930C
MLCTFHRDFPRILKKFTHQKYPISCFRYPAIRVVNFKYTGSAIYHSAARRLHNCIVRKIKEAHFDPGSKKIRKMCILFMYNGTNDPKSDYSLVLVSNRDEYYDRHTQNMAPWNEDPNVLGGRDLEVNEGGTWLAVAPRRKKLGVLLNIAGNNKPDAKSRGKIVADYVKGDRPIKTYIEQIKNYTENCNEFVFVSVEFRQGGPLISSYNNANDELAEHKDIYVGFGNSLPEKPLKKVEAGRNKLKEIITTFNKVCMQQELVDKLIELLKWEESHLPDHQLEKRRPNLFKELSSVYVCIPQGRYGTRTHTIVLVTKTGHMNVIEITQESPIDPLKPKWVRTEYQFDL